MPSIRLDGIHKAYSDAPVLSGINLQIAEGELFFLLGPSGCGKTTLLRIIAGFEKPTAGTLRFGELDVLGLAAGERGIGMVFQQYALWPHMTVFQNVAFGLEMQKVPSKLRQERTAETLALLRLSGLEGRFPAELSGGQQQRVSLARAIVTKPAVLLLDEPLSNLDAKLRTEIRGEIRELHSKLRFTAIYVTHDQEEALTLGDRIAVMSEGKILQVATPQELYERPSSLRVASFLGQANLIPARSIGVAASGTALIRKESLRFTAEGRLFGAVVSRAFHGAFDLIGVRLDSGDLIEVMNLNRELVLNPTDKVRLDFDSRQVLLFDD